MDVAGHERSESLTSTIRKRCRPLDTAAGVTTLGCDLIAGISGAAVAVSLGASDLPCLVAALSSHSRSAAFVVAIAPLLARLRQLLK